MFAVAALGFDSGLNFELRVWTASLEESDLVRSELAVAVHAALAAAEIEIAFPQHDIRIRNADGEQLDFLRREHKRVSDARPIV